MIALNEAVSWTPPGELTATTDEQPDFDDVYEDELIGLLCRLDDLRERMAAAQLASRPSQTLQLAQEMLEQVGAFAEQKSPFAAGRDLEEAAARANDFSAAIAPLRGQFQGSGVRSLFTATARNGSDPTAVQTLARRCFAALYKAVFAYFTIFTSRFSTSRAARSWVEVAAMFSVELRRLTQEIAESIRS
jgi:hypothetical protein